MKKIYQVLEWFLFVVFYALYILMVVRIINNDTNNTLLIEILAGIFVLFLFIYPFIYMLMFFFKVSKMRLVKYILSAIPMITIVIYILAFIFTYGIPRG